jgi:hypothetical protein
MHASELDQYTDIYNLEGDVVGEYDVDATAGDNNSSSKLT